MCFLKRAEGSTKLPPLQVVSSSHDELKANGEESSDTEYMIPSRKMTDAEMEASK